MFAVMAARAQSYKVLGAFPAKPFISSVMNLNLWGIAPTVFTASITTPQAHTDEIFPMLGGAILAVILKPQKT